MTKAQISVIILFSITLIGLSFFILLVCILKGIYPSGDYPTISFNQFIALYQISPEKWRLETDYIQYSCSTYRLVDQSYFYHTNYKIIEFATAFDHFKYKRWAKKESKRKEDIKRSQEMVELIAEWQKDINEAQWVNVQHTKELMKKNKEDAKKYGGK